MVAAGNMRYVYPYGARYQWDVPLLDVNNGNERYMCLYDACYQSAVQMTVSFSNGFDKGANNADQKCI